MPDVPREPTQEMIDADAKMCARRLMCIANTIKDTGTREFLYVLASRLKPDARRSTPATLRDMAQSSKFIVGFEDGHPIYESTPATPPTTNSESCDGNGPSGAGGSAGYPTDAMMRKALLESSKPVPTPEAIAELCARLRLWAGYSFPDMTESENELLEKAAALIESLSRQLTERDAEIARLEDKVLRFDAETRQSLRDLKAVLSSALRAEAEAAANAKDAERYRKRLFELGAMADAPCIFCGYNGAGYFNPTQHPCAAEHHAALARKDGK